MVLGAWESGDLVGLLGISREQRDAVAHKVGLWGWYVRPEHRRKGIGHALLTDAVAVTRATSGVRQIRCVVPTSCHDALSLLERMRFERFGLEVDARKVNGRFHDQVYLWRSIEVDG